MPREAGGKEKDRAEPSLLWAGDTAGNHHLELGDKERQKKVKDAGLLLVLVDLSRMVELTQANTNHIPFRSHKGHPP